MKAPTFWRLALSVYVLAAVIVLACCAGCNADLASPFDKPEATALPVGCPASTPCTQ